MQRRSYCPGLVGKQDLPPVEGFYYRDSENDDVIHKAAAHYGYRTDRYKLISYYNDGFGLPFTGFYRYPPEWEVYDLEADPAGLTNVFDEPAYAEIREELKAAMWREQSRLGDAPHKSQPVPAGCEDVEVTQRARVPRYRWLEPGGDGVATSGPREVAVAPGATPAGGVGDRRPCP